MAPFRARSIDSESTELSSHSEQEEQDLAAGPTTRSHATSRASSAATSRRSSMQSSRAPSPTPSHASRSRRNEQAEETAASSKSRKNDEKRKKSKGGPYKNGTAGTSKAQGSAGPNTAGPSGTQSRADRKPAGSERRKKDKTGRSARRPPSSDDDSEFRPYDTDDSSHYKYNSRSIIKLEKEQEELKARLFSLPDGEMHFAVLETTFNENVDTPTEHQRRVKALKRLVKTWEGIQEKREKLEQDKVKKTVKKEMNTQLLQASTVGGSVAPPASYGTHPTLHGPNRIAQTNNIFGRKKRFKGDPNHDEISIHELLEDLNEGQEQAQLSEIELLRKLQSYLSGPPATIVRDMRREGSSLADVYTELTQMFGLCETAPEAQDTLRHMNRDSHNFASLSSMLCEITRLSGIVASEKMTEEEKRHIKQTKAIEKIMELIPSGLEPLIDCDWQRNRKAKGGDLNLIEVKMILRNHQKAINKAFIDRLKSKAGKRNRPQHNDQRLVKMVEALTLERAPSKGGPQVAAVEATDTVFQRPDERSSRRGGGKSSQGAPKAPQGQQRAVQGEGRREGRGKAQQKRSGGGRDKFREEDYAFCSLCNGNHSITNCWIFPPNHRSPANELCSKCDWQAKHKEEHCLANPNNRRSGLYVPAKDEKSKN